MKPKYTDYQAARYWFLSCLRLTRAQVRIGTLSEPNARKWRKGLQRDLAKLRATRNGT